MSAEASDSNATLSSESKDVESKESRDLRDTNELRQIGKKQVLKRSYGFMAILSFSATVLVTWEAFLFSSLPGFANGGPPGLFYGYIIAWAGTFSVFATLSEATSMAPTSGGQYHWVSMLAPARSHKFLSYITGWLTVLGWQAFVALGAFFVSSILSGIIILTASNYVPEQWHLVLIYWAFLFAEVGLNSVASSFLPKIEAPILILHIMSFFGIMLTLVTLGNHAPPSTIFTDFSNMAGWETNGLSFFVGLTSAVYAWFGADSAIHMCEEIHNARRVVPRAILLSITLNGLMGFGIVLALLFAIESIEDAVNTPTMNPFIEIFYQATDSIVGAAVMSAIVMILIYGATIGVVAAASRQLWAFSRDRAIPGWSYLQRVHPRTSVPVWAVLFTTVFSVALSLIILGSTVAFNDFASLTLVGLFGSYLLVLVLLFYRRLRGDIKPYGSFPESELVNVPGAPLMWGPWKIPGVFGVLNNAFAIIYLIIVFFFSLWPTEPNPTASQMNYGSLFLGAVVIISLLYYALVARKTYKGPVIEVNR